jgi:uncharacterized protein (TIGR02145 family)
VKRKLNPCLGLLVFVLLAFNTCKEEELPYLLTSVITDITESSATSGGEILSNGGELISGRGVCWSTNQFPSVNDQRTAEGAGEDNFTSRITGLHPNTTYYVRAYCMNSNGVAYGEELSFKTNSLITDIDGFVYHSVTIGTQIWMTENLKTTRYRDGTVIPLIAENSIWSNSVAGAYCSYANNNANVSIYGALYNWYAVVDSRGLCPAGWHIPSNDEWTTLTTYLGGLCIAGGKMKETGTEHWLNPNTGADNSSGFTGIGSGVRDISGTYASFGALQYLWSSSEYSPTHGISRKLFFDFPSVSFSGNYKQSGFSVRCTKD